jgi:Tfp pilus assembly protein PilF
VRPSGAASHLDLFEQPASFLVREELTMKTLLGVMLVVGMFALAVPSLAGAAGGGGGDGAQRSSTPDKPEDLQYRQGVKAIKAGKFAEAITLLDGVVARDGTNADAYNWLAYATRKNGDPAKAIPIYEKALTIDPKHRGAHEYIGEAYLLLGELVKAREHLATLDSLCTFSCSEYRDLKKSVEAYEKNGGKTKPAASR